MSRSNQTSADVSSEGNALVFALRNMIGWYSFIDIVKVTEVTGDTLTVISQLHGLTNENEKIDNEPIYGIPYLRLQRGASAVIMDPVVGDIGLMAVCDRDITNVKATKSDAAPNTKRMHSVSDAVYLTGIASLNSAPSQYVHFRDDGIDIVSPLVVTVSSPTIEINGDNLVSINAPKIVLNGQITQGTGSHAGTATFANGATTPADFKAGTIGLKTHRHGGVQTGGGNTGLPTD